MPAYYNNVTFMATSKTGGAFGFLKKSIGSVTYSTIKDGKGKRVQVVRSKPTEVANPNTVAQILQRMKIQPASRFYGAFEEILSNAFEGVQYGPASRREFMRLALSQTGPYIPKGATRFIPAKYTVSSGSQAGMVVSFMQSQNLNIELYGQKGIISRFADDGEDLFSGDSLTTVAQNVFGRDVQLTFMVVTQAADGSFIPHYGRVLTAEHEAAGTEWIAFDGFTAMYNANALYFFKGTVDGESTAEVQKAAFSGVVAATVIVSYKQGETWLRSNALMVINDALEINLYGTAAQQAAIESYQASTTVNELNSTWYLNLANNQPFFGQLNLRPFTLEFDGEEGSIIQRDVIMPIGSVVNNAGVLQAHIFADANGNAIFNINGVYTTMDDPSAGAAQGAKVKANDIILQTVGGGEVYTWKDSYAIQLA